MTVSRVLRPLTPVLLAIAIVPVSGCSWFHKGEPRGDYRLSPQERPLEVPPELNMPDTAGAMPVPSSSSTPAATSAPVPSSRAFTVAGTRDEVFAKLGTALAGIEGLSVVSAAPVLGTYEVSYQGASFLVRVTAVREGMLVSAVDERGMAATGPGASGVMTTLKSQLAGRH